MTSNNFSERLRQIRNLAAEAVSRWIRHDGWMSTAALAFHATLALLPCCLVLIAFLGWALKSAGAAAKAAEALVDLFETDVSPFMARQIEIVLENVRDNAGGGGLLGLVTLAVAAIGMFTQLDEAFAKIWESAAPQSSGWWYSVRRMLRDRLVAACLLLLVAMCLLLLFVANTIFTAFGAQLADASWGATALQTASLAMGPLFTAGLLAVLYRAFSPVKILWRHALIAGFTTMALWEFGRRLLEWLVIGERYSVYGVLGAILALMVWIHYACAALLLGAEIARCLHEGAPASKK